MISKEECLSALGRFYTALTTVMDTKYAHTVDTVDSTPTDNVIWIDTGDDVISIPVVESATAPTEDGVIWIDTSLEALAVPSPKKTLSYTGEEQSPRWRNYDCTKMTISGDTAGTAAGSYSAVFTLEDGFQWTDETTGPKTVTWTIA